MHRRLFTLGTVAALAACAILAGCSGDNAQKNTVLKVGASPVPHADILKVAAPLLAKDGIELKIIEFTDYVQPNLALSDKELDANYFQHIPYLESFSAERNLKLSVLVGVHIEPMGVYSKKHASLKDLPSGAQIAIPNDPTNGGRALKVLADAGLLKLKDGVGANGAVTDVVDNPNGIKLVEMEAAVLPRALDDLDYAVINSNYALGVNLNPAKDALFLESKDSPYVNVIAIRTGDNRDSLKKLAKAVTSPEVKKFIEEKYAGAVVPAF